MSAPDLVDRVSDVVDAALALSEMPADDPGLRDAFDQLLNQCERAVHALRAPPPPLGPSIAELRAQGLGIRECAGAFTWPRVPFPDPSSVRDAEHMETVSAHFTVD
jgi:hypothetical protein